jgi:hypothetical protein
VTIYGRAGDVVTLKRLADAGDVLQLEGREPDQRDLTALRSLSYFVVEQDDGTEALHHVAYLRATGGAREIDAIVDDLVLAAIAPRRSTRSSMTWCWPRSRHLRLGTRERKADDDVARVRLLRQGNRRHTRAERVA